MGKQPVGWTWPASYCLLTPHLNQLYYVVPQGYCNKEPGTGWLNPIERYCPTVLDAGNPNLRCQHDHVPVKPGRKSFASSQLLVIRWQSLMLLGSRLRNSSLSLHRHMGSPCVSAFTRLSPYKDSNLTGLGAHRIPLWLHLNRLATSLFPNNFTFWGTGG